VRATDKDRVAKDAGSLKSAVRDYWNEHIHDLEIARHPVGTKPFFEELDAYRFEKLDYLPKVVDFTAYRDRRLLEVGCGVGIDLVRFASHGANTTGVDLSEVAIELARRNFEFHGVEGDLRVMDGECLQFDDSTFDVVYVHGVLQYTHDTEAMISEVRRVLRPGGEAILMVYNKYSWLSLASRVSGVSLEHEGAPVFKKFSVGQFRDMLGGFSSAKIIPERFPVKTRLHTGAKAAFYNIGFVGGFNLVPRALVRRFGWHLMAKAVK
jgi:ubiquinone/menaquinone biosynthesis C-methylase UbiE